MSKPKKQNFTELLDEWMGKLIISIGAGNFRHQVSVMLQAEMQKAYDRGVADTQEKNRKAFERGVKSCDF